MAAKLLEGILERYSQFIGLSVYRFIGIGLSVYRCTGYSGLSVYRFILGACYWHGGHQKQPCKGPWICQAG